MEYISKFGSNSPNKSFRKQPLLNKKSITSFSNIFTINEEKLKKLENDTILTVLGTFKDKEKKANVGDDLLNKIEKVNAENLLFQTSLLSNKKNFNCFLQKDEEEVDCRKATFFSNIYLFGHFMLFAISIATILNFILYYEIDYTVFFYDTAMNYPDILKEVTDNTTNGFLIYSELNRTSDKIENYRMYSKFNLIICHLLVFVSEFVLIFVYIEKIDLKKILIFSRTEETLITSEDFSNYLVEAILILITPNYFINDEIYEITDLTDVISPRKIKYNYFLLSIAIITRSFVILRYFIITSYFFTPRSQRFCRIYSVDLTLFFGLKCNLLTSPLKTISIFFFSVILIGSYIIRIFERVLYLTPELYLNNFVQDIWLTILAITTTGYGDFVTVTLYGRLTVILVVIFGVFIISIITVLMTDAFNFKSGQLKAFNMLNEIRSRDNLINTVIKLVQKCGLLIILAKRKTKNQQDSLKLINQELKLKQKVEEILRQIKNLSKNSKNDSDINYIDIIIDQLSFVKNQIIEIKTTIENFSNEIENSSYNNTELITIKNNLTAS